MKLSKNTFSEAKVQEIPTTEKNFFDSLPIVESWTDKVTALAHAIVEMTEQNIPENKGAHDNLIRLYGSNWYAITEAIKQTPAYKALDIDGTAEISADKLFKFAVRLCMEVEKNGAQEISLSNADIAIRRNAFFNLFAKALDGFAPVLYWSKGEVEFKKVV